MARCGCGSSQCACAVTGGTGITVSGNGSASSPYIVEILIDEDSCLQVMDCVGANLGRALTYDPSLHEIYVNISSDTANMTEYGSDDGIYTPPTVVTAGTATTVTGTGTPENPYVINTAPEVGDTAITAGDGIRVDGSGITSDPYVIAADRPYAFGTTDTVRMEEGALYYKLTPAITRSTEGFVVEDDGTGWIRVKLPRPGVYEVNARYRYGVAGNTFTQNSSGEIGGTLYAAVSGPNDRISQAMTVTRNSSAMGTSYTLVEEWPDGGYVGFESSRAAFNTSPTATAYWSIQYVGPIVQAEAP